MKDLHIISGQTVTMPSAPYRACHIIDGKTCDSADGKVSDRISPSHGVLASKAALGGEAGQNAADAVAFGIYFKVGQYCNSPNRIIAREEVFELVPSVLTFKTLDEALALTNDTDYGLSAGLCSENAHTCLEFARPGQAGTVRTNTWMDSIGELAFGGMKQSGQGREVGRYGFEKFLEVKSLVMRIGRTRAPWVKTPSALESAD